MYLIVTNLLAIHGKRFEIFQLCKQQSCKTVYCVEIDMKIRKIDQKFVILGLKF